MAHDVFVSYASGDKPVADAVCATLESHGIRCWIAPRDVLPGIHYGEAIIDAIHECRIMVLVFSSKANLSGHIPKEIERAVSQGVTVMPLRIEDVAPAKSLDYFIGSVHWLDALTPPLEVHLQRLAANVQTLLSRSDSRTEVHPGPAHAPANAPAMPLRRTRAAAARPTWEYFVIGGLAAVVLILGFLTYRSRFQRSTATATTQIVASKQPRCLPHLPCRPVAVPRPTDKPKKLLAPVSTAAPAAPSAIPATAPPAAPPRLLPPLALRSPIAKWPFITWMIQPLSSNSSSEMRTRSGISQPRARRSRDLAWRARSLAIPLNTKGTPIFCSDRPWAASPGLSDTIATTDATNPDGGVHLDFLTNGGKYHHRAADRRHDGADGCARGRNQS